MILIVGKGADFAARGIAAADRVDCGEIAAVCAGIPAGSSCRKAASIVDKANPVSVGILDVRQITVIEEAGVSILIRHGIGRDAAAGACGDGQIKPIFILVFSAAAVIGEEVHGAVSIAVEQLSGAADGGFSDAFLCGELPAKACAHVDIICCRNAQQPAVRNIAAV